MEKGGMDFFYFILTTRLHGSQVVKIDVLLIDFVEHQFLRYKSQNFLPPFKLYF